MRQRQSDRMPRVPWWKVRHRTPSSCRCGPPSSCRCCPRACILPRWRAYGLHPLLGAGAPLDAGPGRAYTDAVVGPGTHKMGGKVLSELVLTQGEPTQPLPTQAPAKLPRMRAVSRLMDRAVPRLMDRAESHGPGGGLWTVQAHTECILCELFIQKASAGAVSTLWQILSRFKQTGTVQADTETVPMNPRAETGPTPRKTQ